MQIVSLMFSSIFVIRNVYAYKNTSTYGLGTHYSCHYFVRVEHKKNLIFMSVNKLLCD